MKNIIIISSFLLLIITCGCGVRRFMPAGENLYKGASIKIKREKGVKASARALRRELSQAVRPKRNKFLLGMPYKVWWWYVLGEPKKEKSTHAWFRNLMGEPPVFSSKVNSTATAENMEAFLENIGYFHSTVQGDTVNRGYFTKAKYTANIFPRFRIREVRWVNDSSALLKLLMNYKRSLLKPGNPYRLSDIQAERDRLDLRLKSKGYYFFNPDYIMVYADSSIGNHEVNMYLNLKKTIPENARHPYTINSINLFPNYSLADKLPDTSIAGAINIDGLLIRDTAKKFKPELFRRTVTYRPGDTYSYIEQNTTLNRFINLGVFKFVKNRFEAVKDTAHKLDAFYYLTPVKKKAIQTELDAFAKDNRYVGTQVSANWKHRNLFKGAEQLNIRVYGGFEVSLNDSIKDNNNYRVGYEASLNFPRYVIPFFKVSESNLFPPRTKFLVGYEFYRKPSFYTKNMLRLLYELEWKEKSNKRHNFAPISINYLNSSNVTDSFYKEATINPSLAYSIYPEVILGTYYSYTFNTLNKVSRNQWFFYGNLDLSGNLMGLITGATMPRTKYLLNTPFAQYVKADIDLSYKRRFRNKLQLINHLIIGIGLPYDNSAILPFSKQFVIGGANSMRGFPVRTLGPGTYLPTKEDISYYPVIGGDFKLLFNSELRVPISPKLGGAIYVDVGNIWTKDTVLFGPAGQINKDSYKDLGVSSGLGFRYDVSVLIIRLDFGIPLHKPYLPEGQRWVIDKIAFGDSDWRRQNLILNLAIGYPF